MRNIIVFVLLFCSSLILSAQNKSSQFEQDLELINMRFFLLINTICQIICE